MTLPDNILNRIAGENPSGKNLRWEPVYDKVKEARREDPDLPAGDWVITLKVADPALVIRLTTEALSNQSKDLQLAAWLTEALLRQKGPAGLKEGLDLCRGLIEKFWETLYPEPEDGDMELRASPINWIGSYLGDEVRKAPLTQGRYSWFTHKESRSVGYEEACAGNASRIAARQLAIEDNKLTPEAFDMDMISTPREFYVALVKDSDETLVSLQRLDDLCNEKFGRDKPSFGKLRSALEDVRSLVQTFLKTKQEPEPQISQPEADSSQGETQPPAAPAQRPIPTQEPVDREDALRRIVAATNCLRRMESRSPVSYLILRGLQWGELLSRKCTSALTDFEPPPSEKRQELKRLARDGQWSELLDASEVALGLPSGMAWLDIHRYSTKACESMGSEYNSVAKAIESTLANLLTQIPELPQAVFLDDTAVASPESIGWLQGILKSSQPGSETALVTQSLEDEISPRVDTESPDAQDLAMQAARAGHIQEAMEILTREIFQERSGRTRFERKMQLAGICLASGHESIAYPILKDLAQEIEQRKLAEWESPSFLANSLALLFVCINKVGGDAKEKQEIYERICRLDPVQALDCLK